MDQAVKTRKGRVLPLEARSVAVVRDGLRLLNGLDLVIPDTAHIAVLLGPNGSGKSLLVRILAGLLEPDEGCVLWRGQRPSRREARHIGLVFQKPALLDRTVAGNVAFALSAHAIPRTQMSQRIGEALAVAGLEHRAQQAARSLSGGEQQRLALARAVACSPDLLILDEPTANLDPASTAAIEKILRDVRASGTPVLFITHDIAQARRLADRVIFIHKGVLTEVTPASEFFQMPASPPARQYMRGELLL